LIIFVIFSPLKRPIAEDQENDYDCCL